MKNVFLLLSLFIWIIGCNSSRSTTEETPTREVPYEGSVEYVLNLLTVEEIEEPVSFIFNSSLPSDTLFPYSHDTYEPIIESEGYAIDVEELFQSKIDEFLDVQFSNLDSTSDTEIIVALTGLDIREGFQINEATGNNEITTMVTSFVIVEIYQEGNKIFSELYINEGSVINEADNFEDSHLASIKLAHENAIMKLIGVFKGCREILCVPNKQPLIRDGESVGLPGMEIINLSSEGNLESLEPIVGCVDINSVTNKNTPADILPASRNCINESEYDKALRLSFLARIYAFFDIRRVSDGTAHQAILMLEENTFATISRDQIDKLEEASIPYQSEGSDELLSVCNSISELGKPDYHPSYMIQHGLGAFFESEDDDDGLIDDFDSDSAWTEVLAQFGCMN